MARCCIMCPQGPRKKWRRGRSHRDGQANNGGGKHQSPVVVVRNKFPVLQVPRNRQTFNAGAHLGRASKSQQHDCIGTSTCPNVVDGVHAGLLAACFSGQFFDFFCEKCSPRSCTPSIVCAENVLCLRIMGSRSIFSDLVHVLGLKKASKKVACA